MKDIAELEQEIILNKTKEELKLLHKRFNEAFEERDTNAMLNLTYDMIDAITFEKSAGELLSSLNVRRVKRIEDEEAYSDN